MSLFTDLREMSDSAFEQLADRFPELPAPVLAAIGAGDVAAERLTELRHAARNADVTGSLGQLAATAPAQAQKLLTALPSRAGQAAQSVSPDSVRETVGSIARRVEGAYEDLARRGGRSWARTRLTGLLDVTPGTATTDAAAADAMPTDPMSPVPTSPVPVVVPGPDPTPGNDTHPRLPVDAPAAPTRKPRVPRAQTGAGRTTSPAGAPTTAVPTVTPAPSARRSAATKSGTAQSGTAHPGTAQSGTAQSGTAQSGTAESGTAKSGRARTATPKPGPARPV